MSLILCNYVVEQVIGQLIGEDITAHRSSDPSTVQKRLFKDTLRSCFECFGVNDRNRLLETERPATFSNNVSDIWVQLDSFMPIYAGFMLHTARRLGQMVDGSQMYEVSFSREPNSFFGVRLNSCTFVSSGSDVKTAASAFSILFAHAVRSVFSDGNDARIGLIEAYRLM
jgi:hypothetical protein